MRVTTQSTYLRTLSTIRKTRSDEADAIEKISSGKDLVRISDDPVAAMRVRSSSSVMQRLESRVELADDLEGQLATYDSSLTSVMDVLKRLQEIATTYGTDTYSSSDRLNAADEVDTLRDAMVTLANTEIDGLYIYSGNRTTAAAYDATAFTYLGDQGQREIEIGPGNRIDANIPGDEVFGGATRPAATDVFGSIAVLSTALRTNDATGIRNGIGSFISAIDQVGTAQARIGGRLASVSHLRERNVDGRVNEAAVLASYRDADLAEAATELSAAQVGVQGALAATARLAKISLLDLL